MIVDGNCKFADKLCRKLIGQEGNLFFSPYSISTVLAMTYAGARGNTEKQMARVLLFDWLTQKQLHPEFKKLIDQTQSKTTDYQLKIANALWGQKGYNFLEEFLKLTKTNYGAGFKEVDFGNEESACKTINNWIEKQTENKIKNFIQRGILNPKDMRLILTNAIYFKGNWANQFDKKQTKESPFYIKPDKEICIPMMYKKSEFKFMETDKFQAIELPYGGGDLSMIILLPKTKEIDGIIGVENSLILDGILMRLGQFLKRFEKQDVKVYLPRFEMTSKFELKEVLASIGMPDAFSFLSADFSGMTGKKDLFISAVIHKAFVDVNEEGTEATTTTVVMECLGASSSQIFRADHPFMFLIWDNRSGSILFVGRLMDPTEN